MEKAKRGNLGKMRKLVQEVQYQYSVRKKKINHSIRNHERNNSGKFSAIEIQNVLD